MRCFDSLPIEGICDVGKVWLISQKPSLHKKKYFSAITEVFTKLELENKIRCEDDSGIWESTHVCDPLNGIFQPPDLCNCIAPRIKNRFGAGMYTQPCPRTSNRRLCQQLGFMILPDLGYNLQWRIAHHLHRYLERMCLQKL